MTLPSAADGLRGDGHVPCRSKSFGRDGQAYWNRLGITCSGREQCHPLGAQTRRVGRILLVGSQDDFAVVELEGGTDRKIRIGSIGQVAGFFCLTDQLFLGCGQLFYRTICYLCSNFHLSHSNRF